MYNVLNLEGSYEIFFLLRPSGLWTECLEHASQLGQIYLSFLVQKLSKDGHLPATLHISFQHLLTSHRQDVRPYVQSKLCFCLQFKHSLKEA